MIKRRAPIKRLLDVALHSSLKDIWFKTLFATRIYRRFWVTLYPLDAAPLPVDSTLDISFGLLKSDEVNDYMRLRPDQTPEEIQRRFKKKHLCFVARLDDRPVAAVWACADSAQIEYVGCDLLLPPGVIYSYDLFIAPEYRGHRLSAIVYYRRLQYLQKAGYHTGISILWPENRQAARHFEKLGLSTNGVLRRIQLGLWKHHFLRWKPAGPDTDHSQIILAGVD